MTAQQIFSITVDLISERLDSGTIDTTNTLNYQKRTPGLLTMLQTELCKEAPLYKNKTINVSTAIEGYVAVNFDDATYYSLSRLLSIDLEPQADFKMIGDALYVPFDFEGIAVYKYIPEAITEMSDTMDLDNYICSTVLPCGLASQLLRTENEDLSNYFERRYTELKQSISKKQPSEIGKVKDVYNSTLSF